MPIDASRQTVSSTTHDTCLTTCPATKRPRASDRARMLAICTLSSLDSDSTFSLKVGSQVMMPCSTITNRKALSTKKITSGSAISRSMPTKSSFRLASSCTGTCTPTREKSSSRKASPTSVASSR